MDGVVCNFLEKFEVLKPAGVKYDKKIFREAVMDGKIFEDLNWMPNGKRLINHVRTIRGVKVEMLTSVGTHCVIQGAEAARQKAVWLKRNGIDYHPNFVKMFSEKKKYANHMSILIDDRPDCALPFTEAGGYGILHEDTHMNETLATLDSIVLRLETINAATI